MKGKLQHISLDFLSLVEYLEEYKVEEFIRANCTFQEASDALSFLINIFVVPNAKLKMKFALSNTATSLKNVIYYSISHLLDSKKHSNLITFGYRKVSIK
jgi:hypothetical protein